ncbi:MAG: nucleoside phosphorylase [Myxococcota bacterium]|jgi:uridine phosphorylase|nr:nucleoside phosphorylase [Myxococcota bacterium]
MSHEDAHHLQVGPEALAGNDGLGRYVLLPGSPGRARRIGGRLLDAVEMPNSRGHNVITGRLERGGRSVDVAAVATGMGCPSLDIIVNELIGLGARRFLRVGTTGTLQDGLAAGHMVVASGAVRDEGASDAYTPREFPAVADPVMVEVLCATARRLELGDRTWCGIVHSKDSFFGREFAEGPDAARNAEYMRQLSQTGVLATEMEAAHLFVLGSVFGGPTGSVNAARSRSVPIRCGALMAVIGDLAGFYGPDQAKEAEGVMIDLALESMLDLAALEG